MRGKHIDILRKAFTIVELMVSIVISVLLLGGIFYFMSDTILWISRSSAQANFLKEFYWFTTILDSWDLEILHDYDASSFDVALLRSLDGDSGVLIWVVDGDDLQLSATGSADIYHKSVLWYRSLSSTEITAINADPDVIYDYNFFGDKTFQLFYLRNFQLTSYNSWSTVEMTLDISPSYNPNFQNQEWLSVPQNEVFTYSLVF